jgi:hypothetical protein
MSSLSRKLWFTSRTRARLVPVLVHVTRVLALMVSEVGLKEPPPPAMVMLAVPVGTQLGCGLGLGDVPGLGLGDVPGLGLGDVPGLGLGDVPGLGLALGEGLGLVPWACATVAPTVSETTLRAMSTHRVQSGCFAGRACGALTERVALSRFKLVVIILFVVLRLRRGNRTRCKLRRAMESNAVVTFEGSITITITSSPRRVRPLADTSTN